MKILFLHGWTSVPGGVKPTYLAQNGHEVINPKLDDDDFDAAVQTAQAEFDKHKPDVIVGSSRGGALAMNLDADETPLVLLCPAWKKYGSAKTIRANCTILHSRADDVVPFSDSEELVRNSGLRILVERLWPRGVSKENAAIDLWLKDLAPSTELRKWYGHDPEKWDELRKRYWSELGDKGDLLTLLKHRTTEGNVTFVFAASDEERNSAVALKKYLEERL